MVATGEEDLGALEEYSFLSVFGPAMPSSHSPIFFWKARTAASVAPPNSPSALPPSQPRAIRRVCIVRTSLPLEPILRYLSVTLGVLVGLGVRVTRGVAVTLP